MINVFRKKQMSEFYWTDKTGNIHHYTIKTNHIKKHKKLKMKKTYKNPYYYQTVVLGGKKRKGKKHKGKIRQPKHARIGRKHRTPDINRYKQILKSSSSAQRAKKLQHWNEQLKLGNKQAKVYLGVLRGYKGDKITRHRRRGKKSIKMGKRKR